MTQRLSDGRIEVIAGVMFSGKSEELIRRVNSARSDGIPVGVFKSKLDDRYDGTHHVTTHGGARMEATPLSHAAEIARHPDGESRIIAIDEVQFLDEDIVVVAQAMADRGQRIILAGTDMDFRGQPFGPMGALMAIAEQVDKLNAVCAVCGEPASRNQRLIGGRPAPADGPVVLVGGADSYEARCRACHEVGG